jgi:hypothetical protein
VIRGKEVIMFTSEEKQSLRDFVEILQYMQSVSKNFTDYNSEESLVLCRLEFMNKYNAAADKIYIFKYTEKFLKIFCNLYTEEYELHGVKVDEDFIERCKLARSAAKKSLYYHKNVDCNNTDYDNEQNGFEEFRQYYLPFMYGANRLVIISTVLDYLEKEDA